MTSLSAHVYGLKVMPALASVMATLALDISPDTDSLDHHTDHHKAVVIKMQWFPYILILF